MNRILLGMLMLCSVWSQAQIKYQFSSAPETGKEFEVSFKIPIKGLSGMARLQQDFPKGFEVSEAGPEGAILTFANSSLQLLWIQLPEVDSLPVRYTVKALQGYGGKAEIPGNFQYLRDSKREVMQINPMVLQVSGEAVKRFTPVKKESEPTATTQAGIAKPAEKPKETPKPATNTSPQVKPKGIEATTGVSDTPKESAKANTEAAKKPVASSNASNAAVKEATPAKKSVKTDKVSFRIQIAAAQDKANVTDLAKKFNIEAAKIREEEHSGMFKYTVGEFSSLPDARKELNANPAMKSGAFVAGYQNGQRIDLEDAIRLSKAP